MKKLARTRLDLKRETVRALDHTMLEHAAGGRSGLVCPTREGCPLSYSICGNRSQEAGC